MAQVVPNSATANNQWRTQELAKKYGLDRLDVDATLLDGLIYVHGRKGDKMLTVAINQQKLDWESVEHVVSDMFDESLKKQDG